jgi:hypothetical protein
MAVNLRLASPELWPTSQSIVSTGLETSMICRAMDAACGICGSRDRRTRPDQIKVDGEFKSWRSSPDYDRLFCPICGSRMMARVGEDYTENEVSTGNLDEPGRFEPDYEVWISRREAWLQPLPVEQHERDRFA